MIRTFQRQLDPFFLVSTSPVSRESISLFCRSFLIRAGLFWHGSYISARTRCSSFFLKKKLSREYAGLFRSFLVHTGLFWHDSQTSARTRRSSLSASSSRNNSRPTSGMLHVRCCSVLQCVAVCCSAVQWVCVLKKLLVEKLNLVVLLVRRISRVAVCCSVLQCIAVYCSVL